VRSSFEVFIETNLMVQSEFNLVFWFMSYNIFYMKKSWHGIPGNMQANRLSRARGRPLIALLPRMNSTPLNIEDRPCSGVIE
jgi:hypothetical protein